MGEAFQQDPRLAEVARLRAAVLADAGLAAALLAPWRPDVFVPLAAKAAVECDVALDAEQIGDLLTAGGRRSAPLLDIVPPPGWLPRAVTREGGATTVSWTFFGAHRLREPAYQSSLTVMDSRPFNQLFGFSTPLPEAPAGALAPAGFIFHMSRCGSTLAAQMLAASDANIVVAEAPAIDEIIRSEDDGHSDDARVAQLAAIVGAFGQRRGGGEQRLFLKLDSWHVRALPLFRRAFPATPWAFLHREPTEVLVSLMRQPSLQVIPELVSPAFLGVEWGGEAPLEDYAAKVLAAICEAALAGLDGAGLVVGYDELPEAIWTRVLPHFGVTPTPDEITAMQAVAGRDAKLPTSAFTPDAADKLAGASEAVRAAVRRHLADVSARLAALRQSGARAP